MLEINAFAAEILETSASGIANAATNRLLANGSLPQARDAAAATKHWRGYYVQRVLELAAAVRIGAPDAFAARAVWQHKAFLARGLDVAEVPKSLESLKATLNDVLPDESVRVIDEYIERSLAVLRAGVTADATELDPNDSSGAIALKYLAACLEGDSRQASAIVLQHAADAASLEAVYLGVLFPALREIGRMWHTAEASIAEEHIVTEATRRLMALLTVEFSKSPDIGKTVVTAAVAGNAHDIGVRAVADFFEAAGWRSLSLGPHVPAGDIASAARYFDADLVVIAAMLTTQLKSLEASIAAVRSVTDQNVKILAGGQALDAAPELWRQLGADGYAAAGDAVEVGSAIVA